MKQFNSIFILSLVWLLWSCSGKTDEPGGPVPPEPAGLPICLTTGLAPQSRAGDPTPLQDINSEFAVIAKKTMADGTSQIVMARDDAGTIPYAVMYDASNLCWYYDGITYDTDEQQYLKYWDLAATSYTFAAVTPIPDNSESASYGFKNTTVTIGEDITIGNVHGNLSTGDYTNSSHAPEWMVAKTRRDNTPARDTDLLDAATQFASLSAFTDNVPLMFHPLMAKVDFVAYANAPLIINTFKVEVADGQEIVNRGDYSTGCSTDGGWTRRWTDEDDYPLVFGTYDYLDGKTLSTDRQAPTLLASHVEIPQSWDDSGRKFHVTITTNDNRVIEADIVITTDINNGNDWKQGWHYTYVLHITNTGSDEVILVDVLMDLWYWKEGDSIDDVQTNW